MSKLATLISLLLLGFTGPLSDRTIPAPADDAGAVLEKASEQLNRLRSIRYHHKRIYSNGDQQYITEGSSFMDFGSTDTIVRLKYQVQAGGETYIFNGTECFTLQQKEKTLRINHRPKPYDLDGGSFFNNSLVTLRRTLPLIAADPSIEKVLKDTVVDGKSSHLVQFSLHKKLLESFGGFFPITEDRTFSFRLLLSKEDYFPQMLIQQNNVDEHTSVVTYTDLNPGVSVAEHSWYYSTYLPQYNVVRKKEPVLLPSGTMAPSFSLPLFGEEATTIESRAFRGKVVLLEFWIRNCGPCIAAVPKLNQLAEKYGGRGLSVLAVNGTDAKPTITHFVERYMVSYPIAYNGSGVAEAYGVSGFPSLFIQDRNGRIIYSGGFDEAAVVKVLEKAL